MPSNHLIFCRPLLLLHSNLPALGSFPMSQFFISGGRSIGVSASVSVLPMNIQDWFPLGLIWSISLQSKGLSRVFSWAWTFILKYLHGRMFSTLLVIHLQVELLGLYCNSMFNLLGIEKTRKHWAFFPKKMWRTGHKRSRLTLKRLSSSQTALSLISSGYQGQ